MNETPDALNVIGPDCGSWGMPARSVSGRSYINANGFASRSWVGHNNALISRKLGCSQGGLVVWRFEMPAAQSLSRRRESLLAQAGFAHVGHAGQSDDLRSGAAPWITTVPPQ